MVIHMYVILKVKGHGKCEHHHFSWIYFLLPVKPFQEIVVQHVHLPHANMLTISTDLYTEVFDLHYDLALWKLAAQR